MPYVKSNIAREIDQGAYPTNKGELNYGITRKMIDFLCFKDKVSYHDISDAIAAARDAADEMKRRLLDPYENKKIIENGDVYPKFLLDQVLQREET